MSEIQSATSKAVTIIRVTSGNFFEMFDFFLFGFFATQISHAFFPSHQGSAGLIYTFLTFGAGFLMRPLGAIVLGAYIDRVGRRQGLIVTLSLMAIGTVLLAFTPSYAQIGMAAQFLVLAGRLVQGFSAGAELGGVSVYLAEIAPPGQRGFYTSWQSGSQQLAIIVSAVLGYALQATLGPAAIDAWGWRVPFFIGCLIVPLLFTLRRSLEETKAFRAQPRHPSLGQVLRTIAAHWEVVLAGVLLVAMTTVSFYFITVYTPTFGKAVLHLPESTALIVTFCIGLSNFIWLPIMGAVSDRVGRKSVLVICTGLAIFTAYPALAWLTAAPHFRRMLTVELWLSFIYASYNGSMIPALTEVMPEDVRSSGFSLAYSLATALFGGFTPFVATALIQATGAHAIPAVWLSFAALCGLCATLFLYRRAARSRGRLFADVPPFRANYTEPGD
jgi:MFS transporter, MHS family, citrate/tricarballylate:H+ symporter